MIQNTQTQTSDVEVFYTQKYSQEDVENLCMKIAKKLIQLYFKDNMLTNESYEKDIFKIIKKLLIKEFSNNTKTTEFNVLLSIYIFKKHFKLIFQYLSEYIMEELAYSNEGVINFLKYYSLDTLVIDRIKYKVPQIKVEDGPRWNVTSMLSTLKTYVKTQNYLNIAEKEIHTLEDKQLAYYVDNLNPIEHNQVIEEKYKDLEIEITKNASHITIIHDSLSILSKETDILKVNEELEQAQELRMALRDKKAQLTKAKIKQINMLQYQALIKQVDTINRDSQAKYKIIEKNKDTYLSIKNALIKALISKKQAL